MLYNITSQLINHQDTSQCQHYSVYKCKSCYQIKNAKLINRLIEEAQVRKKFYTKHNNDDFIYAAYEDAFNNFFNNVNFHSAQPSIQDFISMYLPLILLKMHNEILYKDPNTEKYIITNLSYNSIASGISVSELVAILILNKQYYLASEYLLITCKAQICRELLNEIQTQSILDTEPRNLQKYKLAMLKYLRHLQ